MQLSSIDVHYLPYERGRRGGGTGLLRSQSAVNNRPQVASVTADLISCDNGSPRCCWPMLQTAGVPSVNKSEAEARRLSGKEELS